MKQMVSDARVSLLSPSQVFPVALMRRSCLEHNQKWISAYCAALGVEIAPHGKTPMIPAMFERQMQAGSWAITVADLRQAQVAIDAGISRILLANQVVGHADTLKLANLLAGSDDLEIISLVDSVAGVRQLVDAAYVAGLSRPVPILIEGGLRGGRCGVRSLEDASAVFDALSAAGSAVSLLGVEGYEGVLKPTDEDVVQRVAAFADFLCEIARLADERNLIAEGEVILSAGGTKFHDIVVDRFKKAALKRDKRMVIRSGCYLFHDHGIYEEAHQLMLHRSEAARAAGRLEPALEVWAQVLSRPEEGIVILNAGKRHCPYDAGFPTVLGGFHADGRQIAGLDASRHEIFALHDQHGYVRVPADSQLAVGDLMRLGISHPCTLFDKWRHVLEVDDDFNILQRHQTWF
ncbi:amino acid aldolase [Nitratireductor sp. ZSWI3]|uniref:amino acid aldolase n=1 Tax=Nitratireductor sp. ZSWI3 TaxID=2966359 RepID=UPI00214F6B75|nr:amino acid aldolase [Nitratireductor sp. ZSWI3]MCR4265816.1 amino acid aldolase [Nitratireductor sp. ZSWI3]